MAHTGKFGNGTIYIGTQSGLYRSQPQESDFKPVLLGLQGKGALTTVCQDLKDSRQLCVGTLNSGVYTTQDAGRLWRESNGGLPYREIWSTAQHPRTGELYVGT